MYASNHRKRYKIPARKRSEIQLLLDGDKPPGQRISAEEIPIFTAEDPSNRATRCNALQSKGSWTQLGTGTRKITPVEPFTYPISPTLIPKKMTGIKRSLSESDAPFSSDVSSPPPKMARVSETDEQQEECMDDGNKTLEEQDLDVHVGPFSKSLSPPHSPTSPPPPNFENEFDEKIHNPSEQTVPSVAPEGLFCAEMVVFDSRGECLLDKGEYSILMQKCCQKAAGSEPPPLVTFSPLSWSSIFGGGEQVNACSSVIWPKILVLGVGLGFCSHSIVSKKGLLIILIIEIFGEALPPLANYWALQFPQHPFLCLWHAYSLYGLPPNSPLVYQRDCMQ